MTKDELEQKKLELEIKDLKKTWLQKPDILKVLLPTILAILSLIYAITTGLFSSKMDLLELKKQQLSLDISKFQTEKANLIEANKDLEIKGIILSDSMERTASQLNDIQITLFSERHKILGLNNEIERLKSIRDNYNQQIKNLRLEYEYKKQKYLDEIESNYHQEIDLGNEIEEQEKQINQMNARIQDLEYNIEILQSNPFIKSNNEFDFKIWESERMVDYYHSKVDKNDQEIEKLEESIKRNQKSLDTLNVKQKLIKIK